jgi:hypothetical protein
MKTAEEWCEEMFGRANWVVADCHTIRSIQADAFKAGQEATMKWVGEECRRQTGRLLEIQRDPDLLFRDMKFRNPHAKPSP